MATLTLFCLRLSPTCGALVAPFSDPVAPHSAGLAALHPDSREGAPSQELQGLAETEGQAISYTSVTWFGIVALLRVALLCVLWPGLVVTLAAVLLSIAGLGIDTLHQSPLYPPSTGSSALAPGPHHPLGAGVHVTPLGAVGLHGLLTSSDLGTGDEALLLPSSTQFRALTP